jgi:hypothetical protein
VVTEWLPALGDDLWMPHPVRWRWLVLMRLTSTGTAQAHAEVEGAAGAQRAALSYRPSQ